MFAHRSSFVAALLASTASIFAAEPAFEVFPVAPAGAGVEAAPRVMFFRAQPAAARRVIAGPVNADVLVEPAAIGEFKIEMKKVAYLGVSTSPVSAALASQLKLPEGFGLVVDYVEPKGPADAAGLKQHDIMVRVGDQKLVNIAQFGALVRSQKPGDEIELVVIRAGKESKLKAKLIEKEMPVPPVGAEGLPFGADPFDFQWEPGQRVPGIGVPQIKRFDVEILKPRGVQRYSDDEHDLEIKQDGEARKLIVKDKAGKVVFEGPIGTDEQRKAVPDAVKPKLEKLEKSSRVQWRGFGGPGGPGGRGAPGAAEGGAIELDLDGVGPEVEKMIELHLKQLQDLPGLDQQALQKQIDAMRKQMEEMRKQMEKHRAEIAPGALPPGVPGVPGQKFEHRAATSSAMASMADDEHSITYKMDDKDKHLTAKDKEGKVLFDGPINTDEERAKIPAEIKAKLDKLENSVRVNQNFELRVVPGLPGRLRNQPEDPESKDRPREDRKEEQREKPVL